MTSLQVWCTTSLLALPVAGLLLTASAAAEAVTISLSQEQDGGEMGRACIYVHQGKAQYRIVKPQEKCEPEITVDMNKT